MPNHPRYVRIKVDGLFFSSLAELARFYDLNYQQVTKRFKAGWSAHEIAHGKGIVSHNAEKIFCDGKEYRSISSLAKAFKIPAETVRRRIKHRNLSPEEAVGLVDVEDPRKVSVIFKGKNYLSKAEIAREYGIKKGVFDQRLRWGWPLEEALGLTPHKTKAGGPRWFKPKKRPQECDGKRFPGIGALAKEYDLKDHLVRGRINLGWTPEQAVGITAPPNNRHRRIMVAGKAFNSLEDAATNFGIIRGTFISRLDLGWTPEQAAELEPSPGSVEISGQLYRSVASFADEIGISYSLVKSRIGLGWSLDEALEIMPREKPLYGSYSEKFFSENPEAKNNPATLYFIYLNDIETDESFHKIGITAQKVKTRFRSTRYSSISIAAVILPLYRAWQWESLILESFAKYKYTPSDEGFSGRTECFKFPDDVISEVKNIVESIS